MSVKLATSVRLSPKAIDLLADLAERLGVTKSSCLEMAIRYFAQHSKS